MTHRCIDGLWFLMAVLILSQQVPDTITIPVTAEEAGLVEPGAAVLAGLLVDKQQLCLQKVYLC